MFVICIDLQVTAKGHRIVVSQNWYLDKNINNFAINWKQWYETEPTDLGKGTDAQKELVIEYNIREMQHSGNSFYFS